MKFELNWPSGFSENIDKQQKTYAFLTTFVMLNILYTITWCITMTIGLDPNQDKHSVGPDLGLNCLQKLSADDKLLLSRKELN